jgi:hypothetical protein
MIPDAGLRGLQRIGLEPLVEEVRGAHRHELDEHGLLALGQLLEARASPASGSSGRGSMRREVGRDDGQDRLDEAGHVDHQLAVFLVRLGVARRPAAQLADRPAVVVDPPQVVAATALAGPSPLRSGVNVPSSGRMSRPCVGSSRSRMISGRSSDTT